VSCFLEPNNQTLDVLRTISESTIVKEDQLRPKFAPFPAYTITQVTVVFERTRRVDNSRRRGRRSTARVSFLETS
jgi:hypothetical protein